MKVGSPRKAIRANGFAALLTIAAIAPALCNEVSEAPIELASAPRRAAKSDLPKPHPIKARAAKPQATQKITMRAVKTMRVDPTPVAAIPVPSKPAAQEITVKEDQGAPGMSGEDIKAFCGNVGHAASDARVAWQAAKLAELEVALKQRMSEYEARVAEAREWLAKREDAMRRADETVIAIYSKMRPDAAASQLASLDDALASAVLMKLNPRTASAILNEIPAERAARLTDAIAGRRTATSERKPS